MDREGANQKMGRALDFPVWDAQGKRVAVVVEVNRKVFLRVFARSGEDITLVSERPLPFYRVLRPQWIGNNDLVALQVRQYGVNDKPVLDVVSLDLTRGTYSVLAKKAVLCSACPDGRYIALHKDAKTWPAVYDVAGKRVLPVPGPSDSFGARPFFFWNPAGERFAFTAHYSPTKSKPQYNWGNHLFVVSVTRSKVTLERRFYQEMQGGYSNFGIGWVDDRTVLFGVYTSATPFLSPPSPEQFTLYRVAVDNPNQKPQPVWIAKQKPFPGGGEVIWLRGGGMMFPSATGSEYVLLYPLTGKQQTVKFPEPALYDLWCASPDGQLLTVVNRQMDKLYLGVTAKQSVREIPL